MLKAVGIHKSYGQVDILKGVDLHVKKGEILSIVGASGAGKSTLLHILGTLDTADRGTLEVNGTDLGKLSSRKISEFRNKHMGFIFQFHHLLPEFTAIENICIPAYIGSRNQKETEQKALELMHILKVDHRKDHKPNELSGGEQQRVAIARALINEPLIVFADEPTGNLDSENARQINQLFLELREKLNQTFVIVTHNRELADLTDRTLLMKDGVFAMTEQV